MVERSSLRYWHNWGRCASVIKYFLKIILVANLQITATDWSNLIGQIQYFDQDGWLIAFSKVYACCISYVMHSFNNLSSEKFLNLCFATEQPGRCGASKPIRARQSTRTSTWVLRPFLFLRLHTACFGCSIAVGLAVWKRVTLVRWN